MPPPYRLSQKKASAFLREGCIFFMPNVLPYIHLVSYAVFQALDFPSEKLRLNAYTVLNAAHAVCRRQRRRKHGAAIVRLKDLIGAGGFSDPRTIKRHMTALVEHGFVLSTGRGKWEVLSIHQVGYRASDAASNVCSTQSLRIVDTPAYEAPETEIAPCVEDPQENEEFCKNTSLVDEPSADEDFDEAAFLLGEGEYDDAPQQTPRASRKKLTPLWRWVADIHSHGLDGWLPDPSWRYTYEKAWEVKGDVLGSAMAELTAKAKAGVVPPERYGPYLTGILKCKLGKQLPGGTRRGKRRATAHGGLLQ